MPASKNLFARLTWSTTEGLHEKFLKAGDIITIGRGDNNSIIINSPKVSRNHARIEWDGAQFLIRDLRSSNGTFVNGKRVGNIPIPLCNGDELDLERLPFKFEIMAPSLPNQNNSSNVTVAIKGSIIPTSQAFVEVVSGADKGKVFPLPETSITIGRTSRQATWDVCLDDGTVSRPHAIIEKREMGYFVIDLGSANGTTVNDLFVIDPVLLSDGDVIGFGESRMIVHLPK